MIPAVYMDHAQEWRDAGTYNLELTPKYARLSRYRKPHSATLDGAIEEANVVLIPREAWDAGKRVVYPYMEGVPLMFLAPATKP